MSRLAKIITYGALAIFATLAISAAIDPANAQTTINVQHDGVTQFCATNLSTITGPDWNFTGTCGGPVNPPNDPNALNNIVGQFTQHACPRYTTSTGQDFSQLWGRAENGTITTQWPFVPSTSLQLTLPPHGRYYGGVFTSPANPGITPHYLKGNGYAGSCRPPFQVPSTARVSVRVVAVGSTPAPTGLCSKPSVPFDNNAWVWFKFAGPDNTSHCKGVIGGTYRYIVENVGAANLSALMTWN